MKLSQFFTFAFAGLAASQSAPSLTEALASQNDSLSLLSGLLSTQPGVVSLLNQAQNITILAPSNEALGAFLNNSDALKQTTSDAGFVPALLSYHVLNGTYYASSFTNESVFIPTLLSNESYANVTGGQRLQGIVEGDNVVFYSALKEISTVTSANVNFTGGTIHIINKVLSIPLAVDETLILANLTAAAGAIDQAGLGETVSSLKDITVFVPNNDAFNNIGNLTSSLSNEQLGSILQYHVIPGTVAYSTGLSNTTIETALGQNITITIIEGEVFVNGAQVVIADVPIANGVAHVIDNVLNPENASQHPDPSATTNAPAFPSAGTATTGVPFTGRVSAPTTTAPIVTSANPGGVQSTSTQQQLGVAQYTGHVGAVALLGGAIAIMNVGF